MTLTSQPNHDNSSNLANLHAQPQHTTQASRQCQLRKWQHPRHSNTPNEPNKRECKVGLDYRETEAHVVGQDLVLEESRGSPLSTIPTEQRVESFANDLNIVSGRVTLLPRSIDIHPYASLIRPPEPLQEHSITEARTPRIGHTRSEGRVVHKSGSPNNSSSVGCTTIKHATCDSTLRPINLTMEGGSRGVL
ncbi:hypothetical protein OIU85_014357 [Salix viminalis]|uniref:Uncharacterized protein n=1 Tax=Salix viminalis TaxID=40686 RepID=A0A9Q0SB58_SALVM|nr:hypothetical protein OIU85_014357 [Salix viminalis]